MTRRPRTFAMALVAGVVAVVAIPAAQAKRSGIEGTSTTHSGAVLTGSKALHAQGTHAASVAGVRVGAAMTIINEKLHDEGLAIARNTRYLQHRDQLAGTLLQLNPMVPRSASEMRRFHQAIQRNTVALNRVNRLISLSHRHLTRTLPRVDHTVNRLIDALAQVAGSNPRVAGFVLFAMKRQQNAMAQLQGILNQEEASAVTPGQ